MKVVITLSIIKNTIIANLVVMSVKMKKYWYMGDNTYIVSHGVMFELVTWKVEYEDGSFGDAQSIWYEVNIELV